MKATRKKRQEKPATLLLEIFDDPRHKLFSIVNTFLSILTFVSVITIVLESVPSFHDRYRHIFQTIEWVVVGIFSLEYIARIATAKRPFRYIFSFFGLIDLLTILPSLTQLSNFTFLKSARVIRIIRLLRLMRVAKIAKAKDKEAASHSVYKLNLQIYFFSLSLAILVLGSLFYTFESGVKEGMSIPGGMYWSLRAILGGIPYPQPETLGGMVTLILSRVVSLVLLGLMAGLMGVMLRKLLIGSEKDS